MELNTKQNMRWDSEVLQWLKAEGRRRGMSWAAVVRWIVERYRIQADLERHAGPAP